jgi:hypothetical protein
VNAFQNATYVSTLAVSANPVYNLLQRFVALNGLNFQTAANSVTNEGSLVNGAGTGWQAGTAGAFSTLLNAHCNPSYTPVSSAFKACGADGTIRHGQSQDSDSFSPYQATSVWDFDVIDMVWDTMLLLNPDTGGPTLQLSNYMVTSHTSSFNPAESSTSPGLGSVVGTTTQVWHLRPDLSFHDGIAVKADDVCFSVLSYRDMPAALLQPAVINVATCTAVNDQTVQVKLGLSGPFYDDEVGGVPILPHHVWGVACNWPVGSPEPSVAVLGASQCANPADDPMVPLSGQTTGRMIGSGAYMCLGVANSAAPGVPGGPCSQTASGAPGTSSNTLGGKLLLTKFQGYHRGPVAQQSSKYHKFSYGDKFNTGLVTIADISDAAIHNKHYDPYWSSPLFSSSPALCQPLTTNVVATDSLGNPTGSPTISGKIQVSGPAIPGTITFTASTKEPVFGSTSTFSYSWDFGDGSPLGTGNPVSHTYATAGPFLVSESVTDASGLTGSIVFGGGNLQCADTGDLSTVALYKGIGATDPIPLSQYVGLDPHINRFSSGTSTTTAAPFGSVYLGGHQTSPNSVQFSTFIGSVTTITSVSALGTINNSPTDSLSHAPMTCVAGLSAPDGPGRSTYTCTFTTTTNTFSPDVNGQTEVEITLNFSNGLSTEVEIAL